MQLRRNLRRRNNEARLEFVRSNSIPGANSNRMRIRIVDIENDSISSIRFDVSPNSIFPHPSRSSRDSPDFTGFTDSTQSSDRLLRLRRLSATGSGPPSCGRRSPSAPASPLTSGGSQSKPKLLDPHFWASVNRLAQLIDLRRSRLLFPLAHTRINSRNSPLIAARHLKFHSIELMSPFIKTID